MNAEIDESLLQFGGSFATMSVRAWYAPNSRGTVFCIPRFEGNGGDFNWLSRRLLAKGYSVICPDLVGRGRSTYFGDPSSYTYDAYIVCLTALSKYAGKKNFLVATSWGGVIATYFLSAMKVRFDRIVLNDVRLRDDAEVDQALESLRQEASFRFHSRAAALVYFREKNGDEEAWTDSVWSEYVSNRVRFTPDGFRMAYDPALPWVDPSKNNQRYDLIPLLARVNAPVLSLYGATSSAFSQQSLETLVARRPDLSWVAGLKQDDLFLEERATLIESFIDDRQ